MINSKVKETEMYALLWDIANGAADRGVFLLADCWSFINISFEHCLS